MDLQDLKNTIAVIEGADRNIAGWKALEGRQVAILPTDSEYFKLFMDWLATNRSGYFDRGKEIAPKYISSGLILPTLIKAELDHAKPFRDELDAIFNNVKVCNITTSVNQDQAHVAADWLATAKESSTTFIFRGPSQYPPNE